MYILNNKPRKSPLDTTTYYLHIIDNLNSANNKGTPVFITDNPDLLDNPEYFLSTSTPSDLKRRFNNLFASIGETRVKIEIYYTDNWQIASGVSFICDDNIYPRWSTVTNWATFQNNFDLTSEKAEFDALTCVAKAAPSDQLNTIAFDNINFDKHLQPLMYFWGYFAKSLPDDSVYPAAIMTLSDLQAVYPDDVFFGDGNSAANVNYLTKIGSVDRHYAGRYILFYSRSSVDAKNIYGYSITQLPTVQKWNGSITTAGDGKSASFTPIIIPMPQGGNADINVSLSWSISGTMYQPTSTPLTGLQPNVDYAVYVKDQFNGIRVLSFVTTVEPDVKLVDPFFKIENANSLKYYEVNGLYPFFDNSKFADQLYYNVEKQCYLQKIKQSNVITTQIKSTYATVEASVKTLQGVEVLTPDVILKVKNTEVQDKRDCTFKRSADGTQVYVYFEGGSQYTPDTTDVINTYYNSTTLPSFCEVGINVQLAGGVNGGFEVVGLLYESNLARYVMVVDAVLPDSVAVYGTCESTYNLEAWDILEFDTVFSTLEAGYYYIEVNATDPDPRYLPRTWRSEPIKVASNFKFNNAIKYFNTENINQIDYLTGITHELNVAGRFVNWSPKGDVTRFNGDEGSTFTLKSVKKRVITFESGYIPQYLAEKLVIAGAHDTVTINDIECRLIEDPEIVSNMDKNNPFYSVSMQMQLSEGIEITDSMGVVSESAAVLGATSTKVIGV